VSTPPSAPSPRPRRRRNPSTWSMCRERCLFPDESPIGAIADYQVSWHRGCLRLDYQLTSPWGEDSFYLIPKTVSVPQRLAKCFGWRCEFYIDGQSMRFDERTHQGMRVYQRNDGDDCPPAI
ncbi:hypothetical protein IJJ12_01395, partial [bacterium]|nr:hypothetical protein [bacterium]